MARLFIAIGYESNKPSADPRLVYLGRSGQDYQAAIKASHYVRHELFPNPFGLRKNNPNASANQAAADAFAQGEPDVVEVTKEQIAEFEAEMKRLQALADSVPTLQAEIESLKAKLAQQPVAPVVAVPPASGEIVAAGSVTASLAEPEVTPTSEPPPAEPAPAKRARR